MAQLQVIDQTTPYPDGSFGDDAFVSFGKINDNFAVLQKAADMSDVSVANNQALYWNGTAWTAYTISAAGRAMLAATDAAGIRGSIKAVGTEGNETVAGVKTYTGGANFNAGITLSSSQNVTFAGGGGQLGGSTGIAVLAGNPTGSTAAIIFRPMGIGTTTNQINIWPDGSMTFAGAQAAKNATMTSLGAATLVALNAEIAARADAVSAEASARAAADTALGVRIDGVQTTANAAMPKSGGDFTGTVNFAPSGGNSNKIRIIADGGGGTALQGVNGAGNAFAKLAMRGSTVEIDAGNQFLVTTTQSKVAGPLVPGGQYAGYVLGMWTGKPGSNDDRMELQYYRETADSSTSWSSFNWRFGRIVDNTAQQYIEFDRTGRLRLNANGQDFLFYANGNATAPGSFINGGSDPAIKDPASLRPIINATDALMGLNTCIGRYLPEFNSNQEERAFVMADDAMREHTPEVIIEEAIQGKYAGWATDQLIAYLVAAHREGVQREATMHATIETLSSRIATLEGGA